MSELNTPPYKTLNWPACKGSLERRGSLTIWFDPEMTRAAAPTLKRGRQPVHSGERISKTVRATVFPAERASMTVPNVALASVFGPMADNGSRRKIHIGIDRQTLEIRAAEFTSSDTGDAPMLPQLLDQIPPDQEIAGVTADEGYDTRKCHDAIAERRAIAVMPPRRNAKPWKAVTAGALAIVLGPMADNGSPRNEALRASKYRGRALWRRWSGDHRRSRVETRMRGFKLFGKRVMAVRHYARTNGAAMAHLRQAGGRGSNPGCNPEPLRGPQNATNPPRGMSPFKGKENPTSN